MQEQRGNLEGGQVKDTYKWDHNTCHYNLKILSINFT